MTAPTDAYALLQYHMIRGKLVRLKVVSSRMLIWLMTLAHYTFTKGFEIMLQNLASPPTSDMKNFLGYCEAWGHSLLHHHDTEVCLVTPRRASVAHDIIGSHRIPDSQPEDGFRARTGAAQCYSRFPRKVLA